MNAPRCLCCCVPAACLLAGAAAAAQWHPVPGAPDVEIDVASLQQDRMRVTAWLRWWGRPPLLPELAGWSARGPRVHRTALRAEFDCAHRTLRTLAANAYDSAGAPLSMASVPGPALPPQDPDLVWAYDAVCEAARSGGRL